MEEQIPNQAHLQEASPWPQYSYPPSHLNSQYISNPAFPKKVQSKPSNAIAMGLFAFGVTTWVNSIYTIRSGIMSNVPSNMVVGVAVFYGGLVQLIAGLWSLYDGTSFDAAAFASFGSFWIGYGFTFLPSTGVLQAYASLPPSELRIANGILLMGWAIFAIMLWIAAIKSTRCQLALLSLVVLSLLTNAIGEFLASGVCRVLAGVCGVLAASIAFYMGLASMLEADGAALRLPTFPIEKEE
ncbi:uncharacterized protein VTP21DRAFT_2285 [Calcarisporiella thermophila]|uniref:uncharacterized protein n=1 Tax=Calcarisporiella thermophila TaxID=911321 RepID=UPI00374315A3